MVTDPPTNRQDRLQYTVPQLARSVIAKCPGSATYTQLYGWAKTVHYNELPCYYLFSWLSRDYREATTVGVRIRISIPSPLHKLESALCGDANPRRLQRQSCCG